jgi:hypothetical protein
VTLIVDTLAGEQMLRLQLQALSMPDTRVDMNGVISGYTFENRSMRLAWAAFTLSLSLDVARSWVGWGDVTQGHLAWLLVAWLLLAAGCCGMTCSMMSRRTGRVLGVLSFVAGLLAAVGMMQG